MSNHTIDATNDILRRMELLDVGIANGRAFLALIEELHARETLSGVVAEATGIARAAMLRSALGCALAALDPPDARDNRASLGQILHAIAAAPAVAAELAHPVKGKSANTGHTIGTLQQRYDAIRASGEHERCKGLRNSAVAHFLFGPTPALPTEYADVFTLQENAEQLTGDLFAFCGGRSPHFREHAPRTRERAKLFWDVFFRGVDWA